MSNLKKYNVGDKIAFFRKRKGWAQQDLADRLGMGRSTISGYESNNHEPGISELVEIANVLDVTLSDLIYDVQEGAPEPVREISKEEFKLKVDKLELEIVMLKREVADKTKMILLFEQHLELYKKQLEDAYKIIEQTSKNT